MARADMTRDLTEEEAEQQFLCEYSMQALAVSASPAGNVIYRLQGCQDNNPKAPHSRVIPRRSDVYPGTELRRVHRRPQRKVAQSVRQSQSEVPLSAHDIRQVRGHDQGRLLRCDRFLCCASPAANCARVANQDAFDGRKAFSDFVLFIYEAMSDRAAAGARRARAVHSSIRCAEPSFMPSGPRASGSLMIHERARGSRSGRA